MEQTERIKYMEEIMNGAEEVLSALSRALYEYREAEAGLRELEAYYHSELWRRDYADDEAGKLPAGLRRGILSEDGLYNLFSDEDKLKEHMRQILGER